MKHPPLRRWAWLPCLAALLGAEKAAALSIEFDYTYDNSNFFTPDRQVLMGVAASFYSGFSDQLTAITPQAGDTWSVNIGGPGFSGTLTDLSIAADTIRIYASASYVPCPPGSCVLGMASTGTQLTPSGSPGFEDSVLTRGQLNTTGPSATDYGVWGGSVWINTNNDWYFGEDASGLTPGHPDFLTTATHEIGHILGYGGDSWYSQIENGFFYGDASMAVFGGPVPVVGSHWDYGTESTRDGVVQGTMMDPSTVAGTRELPTVLDYAGFADIGWEVTPVPLPPSLILLLSATAGLARFARRCSAPA